MDLGNLSVLKIVKLIKDREIKCVDLCKYYLSRIEEYRDKNAVLEVFDDAITRAEYLDKTIDNYDELPSLFGVPILIKDNIFYKGKICSNGSKFMENYVAQYDATVITKLLDAGVVILGRTNMDEFAMGGSCENSAYGPCKNAHNDSRVSGGSSGGSAVAVALDMCAFALGSDTGGSVRQPAAYNGIVGLKPTYGRISRYGLCAYASSLDTVGIFTRDVRDNAYVLGVIAGNDISDPTSLNDPVDDYIGNIDFSIKGKKIAIIKEVQELVSKTPYASIYQNVLSYCQKHGAIVTETSLPEYESVLPAYYTLAPAEASSNMGRYDSIRFASKDSAESYNDLVVNARSQYLGKEVKRRIMLGNFVLSSEYYNAYYLKAKAIAKSLKKKILNILKNNDLIFLPTAYGEAFEIGSKTSDPVSMYIEDMFTVTANIVGLPALSIPIANGETGLPLGLQILGRHLGESEIYNMADYILTQGGSTYVRL